MCISNIFCRTAQNRIELTGWEMYASYVDENYTISGSAASSNRQNIEIEGEPVTIENRGKDVQEIPVLKD